VAIGYDDVDITGLYGSPVIGRGHLPVRGRVSFQRDAAIASSKGVAYTRGSAFDRVVAPASYKPMSSAPNHVARPWVNVYDPYSNARATTQIRTAQDTSLLNKAAMREAAAMTEEDSVDAGHWPEAETAQQRTRNVPETTQETGVAEPRSGKTNSTLCVVVDEPTQHALVEFNPAAAIASTHGSQDHVVVDGLLEEPEEPDADEEITLEAPTFTEDASVGRRRRQGLPTQPIVAREGAERSHPAQVVEVISRVLCARETVILNGEELRISRPWPRALRSLLERGARARTKQSY